MSSGGCVRCRVQPCMRCGCRPLVNPSRQSANTQRGFTLLEAIVALAVLAMAGMALFGWLNSSLVLLKRVDDVYQSIEAVESSLEWLQVLDPHQQPDGQQEIAGAVTLWRCAQQGAAAPANDMYGNLSVNDAQLFVCQIEIFRDQQRLASFELVKLGFEAKRGVEELIF